MKKSLKALVVAGVVALAASTLTITSASAADPTCKGFESFGKFASHPTVKVFAGIRDPEASVMQKVFAHFTACTGVNIA